MRYLNNKNKNKFNLLFCLFTLSCFFSCTIFAQDLKTKEEITKVILTTDEWGLLVSKDLKDFGNLSKIVTLAFREVGIEAEYRFYPWGRGEKALEKGEVWGSFPFSSTPERDKKYLFSDPLIDTKNYFYYYEDSSTSENRSDAFKKIYNNGQPVFNNLEDLKEINIGGARGYFYEKTFRNAGLNVHYTANDINNIHKLFHGRVELAILNEITANTLIQKYYPTKVHNFHHIDKAVFQYQLNIMVSKKYPGSEKLLELFNQGLRLLIEKGIYQTIIESPIE